MRLKIFLDATTILLAGAVVLLGLVLWQLTRTRRDNFLKSRVIAATSSGILITDATAPRHPILHANPAFRLLTGYAEEDVLGQSPQFLNGLHTDRAAIEKIGLALRGAGLAERIARQEQAVAEIIERRHRLVDRRHRGQLASARDGDARERSQGHRSEPPGRQVESGGARSSGSLPFR